MFPLLKKTELSQKYKKQKYMFFLFTKLCKHITKFVTNMIFMCIWLYQNQFFYVIILLMNIKYLIAYFR